MLRHHVEENIADFILKFRDKWKKSIVDKSGLFAGICSCQLVIDMSTLNDEGTKHVQEEIAYRELAPKISCFYKKHFKDFCMHSELKGNTEQYVYTLTIKAERKDDLDSILDSLNTIHAELEDCCKKHQLIIPRV